MVEGLHAVVPNNWGSISKGTAAPPSKTAPQATKSYGNLTPTTPSSWGTTPQATVLPQKLKASAIEISNKKETQLKANVSDNFEKAIQNAVTMANGAVSRKLSQIAQNVVKTPEIKIEQPAYSTMVDGKSLRDQNIEKIGKLLQQPPEIRAQITKMTANRTPGSTKITPISTPPSLFAAEMEQGYFTGLPPMEPFDTNIRDRIKEMTSGEATGGVQQKPTTATAATVTTTKPKISNVTAMVQISKASMSAMTEINMRSVELKKVEMSM